MRGDRQTDLGSHPGRTTHVCGHWDGGRLSAASFLSGRRDCEESPPPRTAEAWWRGLLRGTAVWAVEGAGVKGKGAFPAGSRLWDGETGRWGLGDVGTLPTFFTAHSRSCLGSPDSTGSVVGLNFAMSREDLIASGLLGGGGQDLHPRTVGLVGRKDRSQAQGPSPHLEPTMLQPRCRGLLPPLPLSPWLPVTPS